MNKIEDKKKIIIIISSALVLIFLLLLSINFYKQYKIRHEIKIVKLNTTEIEVFEDIKLKDIIKEINGNLIDNPKIDTTKVGIKAINFNYITTNNIKVPYTININIVDKTPPIISSPGYYTMIKGEKRKEEIEKSFFCGDNYDNNPKCTIEGDFNLEEVGTYKVKFRGEDQSHNIDENNFTLIVKEKEENKPNDNENDNDNNDNDDYTIKFSDIIDKYKTKDNKIGIDISHWQGKIDFNKVKKSKVEFVYIRVGRGDGIGKDYVLDDRFYEYIKGFNKVKIPVGVYFFSYANSPSDAEKEAKWVLKKIKKYKVDLEVVFDWENWNSFQYYDLSFYKLTETAKAFTDTVEKKGYKGMVYSSKYYLENIWYPINNNVWLAHYTDNTNYEGKYKVWQLCDNGRVDGIDDNYVDIDIMYK